MTLPLLSHWRLAGDLPPHLMKASSAPAPFTLPGAQALSAFAELLGDAPAQAAKPATPEDVSAPFDLPALLPDDLAGEVTLSREIDFGALRGDRAVLALDGLMGKGSVLLNGMRLTAFDGARPRANRLTAVPCTLAVDLTDALRRGQRQTLTLRFDAGRPAGVLGSAMLLVTAHAALEEVTLTPCAAERTIAVRARIWTQREGAYALHVFSSTEENPSCCAAASLRLSAGQTRTIELSVPVAADLFSAGVPYDAPAMKLQLWRKPDISSGALRPDVQGKRPFWHGLLHRAKPSAPVSYVLRGRGALCDSVTLLCGYPGEAARAYVPLTPSQCAWPPDALVQRLTALHVTGVLAPIPVGDAWYRACTRTGISVRQRTLGDAALKARIARLPCVTAEDARTALPDDGISPRIRSAWQLCGVICQPRAADPALSPTDMLTEAAGQPLHVQAERVQSVLLWLRAVHVRLLAEAVRQGRFTGALCAAGEWTQDDIADALRTALAPTHLSALPLCGAWWTGTQFSASIHAYVAAPTDAPLRAEAILEDEDGCALARLSASCPDAGGGIGLLRASLPAKPCVLTLSLRLYRGDAVWEESTLPVYVGERGPLEAVFL